MNFFLTLFTFASLATAEPKYRWQTQSFTTNAYFGQKLNTKIYLWPDEEISFTHSKLSVVQGLGNDRGAQVRGRLSKAESPMPIDLKVLVDIGNKSNSIDKKHVQNVLKDIESSFRDVPEGSTFSLYSFPYNYTQSEKNNTKIGYITKSESSSIIPNISFLPESQRTEYSDLGKALIEVINEFEDFDVENEDRIRMIFYITTSVHSTGNLSSVLDESLKQGNVLIFPIFGEKYDVHSTYSTTKKSSFGDNYHTNFNAPGYASSGGFHLGIAESLGTWVLSDNLKQLSEDRDVQISSYERTIRSYESDLRKYDKLINKVKSLEGDVERHRMSLQNGSSSAERYMQRSQASLEDYQARLARTTMPTMPAVPLTKFSTHLQTIYKTFSTPIVMTSEIPCAQGSVTGDRKFNFTLDVGDDYNHLSPISLWTKGSGGRSSLLSVAPKSPFDSPVPEVENVMLWTNEGDVVLAGKDSHETAILSRSILKETNEIIYIIQGKNLCGDAKLEVRSDQHNGIEGVPHNFDEALAPLGLVDKPSSERRVFRVHNIGDATHSMKSRLTFRRDVIRALPGGDLTLPTVIFQMPFFQIEWFSGLLTILVATILSFVGLRAFGYNFKLKGPDVSNSNQPTARTDEKTTQDIKEDEPNKDTDEQDEAQPAFEDTEE